MSCLAHLPSDAFLPQYLRGERRGHGDHLIPLETNDVDRGKKKTTTALDNDDGGKKQKPQYLVPCPSTYPEFGEKGIRPR